MDTASLSRPIAQFGDGDPITDTIYDITNSDGTPALRVSPEVWNEIAEAFTSLQTTPVE